MTAKTALIFATTAAIALASFDLRPAAAAPEGGPAIVKQQTGSDEFSSQRKRRGRGAGVPLAAFGALVGTIGVIAAANSRREAYYGGGPYYYAEPQYVPAPQPYVRHHYAHPGSVYRDHGGGFHGHGGVSSFQRGPIGGSGNTNEVIRSQAPSSGAGDGRM